MPSRDQIRNARRAGCPGTPSCLNLPEPVHMHRFGGANGLFEVGLGPIDGQAFGEVCFIQPRRCGRQNRHSTLEAGKRPRHSQNTRDHSAIAHAIQSIAKMETPAGARGSSRSGVTTLGCDDRRGPHRSNGPYRASVYLLFIGVNEERTRRFCAERANSRASMAPRAKRSGPQLETICAARSPIARRSSPSRAAIQASLVVISFPSRGSNRPPVVPCRSGTSVQPHSLPATIPRVASRWRRPHEQRRVREGPAVQRDGDQAGHRQGALDPQLQLAQWRPGRSQRGRRGRVRGHGQHCGRPGRRDREADVEPDADHQPVRGRRHDPRLRPRHRYVSTVPVNASTGVEYGGGGKAVLWALDAQTGAPEWKWDEVQHLGETRTSTPAAASGTRPPSTPRATSTSAWPTPARSRRPGYPWGTSRPGPDLYTDSVVSSARPGSCCGTTS